jgi:hypothetical protein
VRVLFCSVLLLAVSPNLPSWDVLRSAVDLFVERPSSNASLSSKHLGG